jgi:hypothetical protein
VARENRTGRCETYGEPMPVERRTRRYCVIARPLAASGRTASAPGEAQLPRPLAAPRLTWDIDMNTVAAPKTPAPEAFISYSRQDRSVCDLIESHLANCGILVWVDHNAIEPGQSWVEAIFRGLERADYVLVLVSSHSMNSNWVRKEIDSALINSLSRTRSQTILPVLLEKIELPLSLRSVQSFDLSDGIPHNIPMISDFILRQPIEIDLRRRVIDPTSAGIAGMIETIASNYPVADAKSPAAGEALALKQNILKLHGILLRLQAVVEEFGNLTPSDATNLWDLAGQMMRGPIPGAMVVIETISRAMARNEGTGEDGQLRLALLRRYLEIIADMVNCLRESFSAYVQIEAPELSSQLAQLFRTKVNVNRLIKSLSSALATRGGGGTFSPTEHVRFLEAAKTFEQRTLLQVIDEDARAVSDDPETGLMVFEELVSRNQDILLSTIAARRELGQLLKRLSVSAEQIDGR